MRVPARLATLLLLCLPALCRFGPARADESALCRTAITEVEASRHIPDAFLSAIARVESGRADKESGTLVAWPWTINAEGAGSFFATKAEAIAAVRSLQARGVRSIDVGCLQVNLMHHPDAFASLEQAFDPAANASYAASFLMSLFERVRSWPLAAAAYHSQTPTVGAAYQRRVLAEWAVPADPEPPLQSSHERHSSFASVRSFAGERGGAVSTASAMSALGPTPPAAGRPGAEAPPVSAIGRGGLAFASHPASLFTGRSLAAYRLMPTALAFRVPPKAG